MTRSKIGDVYSVKINNIEKRYFQYIGNDINQLNSSVIRAFDKKYMISEMPIIHEIIQNKIFFYAHTIIKIGIKDGIYLKEGNIQLLGDIDNIIFRSTSDYGTKLGELPILVTNNWKFWSLYDNEINRQKKLKIVDFNSTYVGLVFNPLGIVELMKGNKYPINYPSKLE
ncbi:MAG: hypothetical protein ACOYMA_02960 [Bacteroidia bacterium]